MGEVCSAIKKYAKEHGWKLPKGWKQHVKAIFDHVDADQNGKLTLDEIHAAIFDAVDGNNDGEWSLEEVKGAIEAIAKELDATLVPGWDDLVAEAFRYVDTDKSGKVSPTELEAA